MEFKYSNITISGGIAVGTSTLARNLKPYLEPYQWQFFSGGEFMRQYAIEHGLFSKDSKSHHNATVYSDDFDKQVDFGMRDRLAHGKHLVMEAWLAGYFAKELKNTLKVLLICSHETVRVDRVANRENVSIDQAKAIIKEREKSNFDKWHRMYGNDNFFDAKFYDIVIDTFSSGQLETVGIVLDKLGYQHDKIVINKK